MIPHWSWGLSTAVLLAIVIHLNGRGIRVGWLIGAAVQLVNVTFGWLIYGQPTFGFLAIPAVLFLVNWWQHPKRVKPLALIVPLCADDDATVDETAKALSAYLDLPPPTKLKHL